MKKVVDIVVMVLAIWGGYTIISKIVEAIKSFMVAYKEAGNQESEPSQRPFKLFGGPADGKTGFAEGGGPLPSWYIHPYIDLDEDGKPLLDEDTVEFVGNFAVVKPSGLAYYTLLTDTDFIYVRDISQDEFHNLVYNDELPDPKGNEEGTNINE